jgi:sterol desaturase/sphingolipid hydroxylase (fatty acid hydroxylase superfamily)
MLKSLGIPLGFLAANFTEWAFHKFVLHGLGKNKNSIWNFHWYGHHKMVRKLGMKDPDYNNMTAVELLTTPEAISLIGGAIALIPAAYVNPWFVGTMWACGVMYYGLHYYSHINPSFAYRYLPWHVDHHMGKNQDANYNVTIPVFDYVFNTREITPRSQHKTIKRLYLPN